MVIGENIAYAELFAALEPATSRLKRTVNPTVYSRMEIDKRIRDGNAFVKRVLAQPKLWVIGEVCSRRFSFRSTREASAVR
jgi:hypothetical protein